MALAELGSTGSDDDNAIEDDEDLSNASSNSDGGDHTNGKTNNKQEETDNHIDADVDDDELDRLARVNAQFNTNNLGEKPLKPKGIHFYIPSVRDKSWKAFRINSNFVVI